MSEDRGSWRSEGRNPIIPKPTAPLEEAGKTLEWNGLETVEEGGSGGEEAENVASCWVRSEQQFGVGCSVTLGERGCWVLCLHWGAHQAAWPWLRLSSLLPFQHQLALISKVTSQHCQAAGFRGALRGQGLCAGMEGSEVLLSRAHLFSLAKSAASTSWEINGVSASRKQ